MLRHQLLWGFTLIFIEAFIADLLGISSSPVVTFIGVVSVIVMWRVLPWCDAPLRWKWRCARCGIWPRRAQEMYEEGRRYSTYLVFVVLRPTTELPDGFELRVGDEIGEVFLGRPPTLVELLMPKIIIRVIQPARQGRLLLVASVEIDRPPRGKRRRRALTRKAESLTYVPEF